MPNSFFNDLLVQISFRKFSLEYQNIIRGVYFFRFFRGSTFQVVNQFLR